MSRLYSPQVLDYYLNSPFSGEFPQDEPGVISVQSGSESAGELMQLQLKLVDRHISDVRFKAYGCGYAIACCAWLCQQLVGQSLPLSLESYAERLVSVLNVPADKLHCVVCIETLLRNLAVQVLSS